VGACRYGNLLGLEPADDRVRRVDWTIGSVAEAAPFGRFSRASVTDRSARPTADGVWRLYAGVPFCPVSPPYRGVEGL